MDNKVKDKKQLVLTFFGIIIFIVVGLVVYFSSKSYISEQSKKDRKITNTLTLNYVSKSNNVIVYSKKVFNDQDGMKLSDEEHVFDFSVSSSVKKKTVCNYEIIISKDLSSTIPDDKIRIYLQKSNDGVYSKTIDLLEPTFYKLSDNIKLTNVRGMLLDKGKFKKSETIYYRLKVWVDSTYPLSETDFYKLKVNIYGDV
ncbi:MAG: hypothetical protein IK997_03790 [Bacilli bacterium]|nr:hypothetical protein [Bacilli bacterium]